MITCSKIICNWLAKSLMAKCRPMVIAPAKTGKESNNNTAVIRTAQTNKGNLWNGKLSVRILKIVQIKLIAPNIEEAPAK